MAEAAAAAVVGGVVGGVGGGVGGGAGEAGGGGTMEVDGSGRLVVAAAAAAAAAGGLVAVGGLAAVGEWWESCQRQRGWGCGIGLRDCWQEKLWSSICQQPASLA